MLLKLLLRVKELKKKQNKLVRHPVCTTDFSVATPMRSTVFLAHLSDTLRDDEGGVLMAPVLRAPWDPLTSLVLHPVRQETPMLFALGQVFF